MKYQRIRGMQDLLPEEQPYWSHVEATCHDLATRYGFERLEPPLLEATELFVRGVGDATDIVSKEMYSFVDKGEDALTHVRPEEGQHLARHLRVIALIEGFFGL